MGVHLYVAPAATGKTAYVLELTREAARGLACTPRVCVPTQLQARSWRRRLAEAGGAIGIRLGTFTALSLECLSAAGEAYTELSEPVQYRLIRAVVDSLPLSHHASLRDRPGFVQVLQRFVAELKAAGIGQVAFAAAVASVGDEPRLCELAQIYSAYQTRLQAEGWADRAGIAWLAAEVLDKRAPHVGCDWPLLIVDGFDDLTEVQIALLRVLAGRVDEVVITLTGTVDASAGHFVHRRFQRTRQRLEEALGVKACPLAAQASHHAQALAYLERNLFRGGKGAIDPEGAVECIEAPNRAAEVRSALRWLKARLLENQMRPGDVALLARDIAPYRPFILQTAAEFGLPIQLAGGLPLASNPAITALVDLLRLVLPRDAQEPQPSLPRRLVIEAWRSPYFDWSALPAEGATQPIGIGLRDADALDAAARWGRVLGGLDQWEEALLGLAGRSASDESDGESVLPVNVPVGAAAEALLAKFRRFVQRLTPPTNASSYRDWVSWLEGLIGPDPQSGTSRFPQREEPVSLQVVSQARQGTGSALLAKVQELDMAALQAFKEVLRGLVWAEEAVDTGQPVDLARFFTDLDGATQAASYNPPLHPDRDDVLVSDVVQARGAPFRAIALLGLAEGEFPATLQEDAFLRDADRRRLRENCGLPIRDSTESAEAEFFYEAITRPRERLLLTRPRLADNGATWPASPYWEEIRHWVWVEARVLTGETVPHPDQAASWAELMESMATHPECAELKDWLRQQCGARLDALEGAVKVLNERGSAAKPSAFDGDLSTVAGELGGCYGPNHFWSASRLEAYRGCPFRFFVGYVLRLEPREEPEEGLDARQLGNLYHRILEEVYQAAGTGGVADLDQLLTALPAVAAGVLDQAPRREGFRATAWWAQTRVEIEQNVRRSLQALHSPDLQQGFVPCAYEVAFEGSQALTVTDGADQFRLHGRIDRIDKNPDGRLRVIDYKTGGPTGFNNKAVEKGDKIQLPLYALAVRDGLCLGEIDDGFYWHVRHAQSSTFTLRSFRKEKGVDALDVAAAKAWEAVRGARAGQFPPTVPDDGCPAYCPAFALCWHSRPGFGG